MNNPFYTGPKDPVPQRKLTEVPLADRPNDEAPVGRITPQDVTDLFDGFAFEINRATALIQVLEPRAKKLSIPVDPDAVQVRAAIRRRLPGSTGNEIPFDLYKDQLDYRVKTARKMKFEIATELTGHVLSDAVKIKKYMRTGGGGLSAWDEFILGMEQFALWMLLNQVLGNFSCVEHQECTAAKEPPGTETGPIQLRQAIAMAAMMLIMGLQEDHVMFAVQAPADALKVPPADIINRARKLTQTDLHRELTEIVGASDPQLIIDYADNYIGRNPIGYEDWMAYRDLRNTREYTVTTYLHSHQYSQEYRTLVDYSFEGVHTVPLASRGGFLQNAFGFPRRQATVQYVGGVMDIPPEHYTSLRNQLYAVDRNISAIAGVLTNGFTLDLLCCVGRFLGNEDVERLKKMRSILQIAYNFLSNGIANVSSPAGVMDFVVSAIQQELLAYVERYFDKIAKDMLGWVGSTDDRTWNDLFACPLIEDLVLVTLGAIARFRDEIMRLVNEFTSRTFDFNDRVYKRWGQVYDARRLKAIISIIDRLLAAMEACAHLDEDGGGGSNDPNPGEDPTIYDGVPKPLILPAEVVEKFFANPHPISREGGARPLPPVGRIEGPGDPSSTRNFREICRGILPDELLEAVFKSRESA